MSQNSQLSLEPLRVDFRLSDILYELYYLGENYHRIELQIPYLARKAKEKIWDDFGAPDPTDDKGGSLSEFELMHSTTVIIPRLIRHSFLVSLYAVYESSVKEIAEFIRVRQSQPIKLDDLKGKFPGNAWKYYKHVLNIKLARDDVRWQRVRDLARLRNAIVHANGRLGMVRDNDRRIIENMCGIEVDGPDLMIVGSDLLDEIFVAVEGDLQDLVSRCKAWDSDRENED